MLIIAATTCWASLGLLGKFAFALGIGPQALATLRTLIAVTIMFVSLALVDRRLLHLSQRSLPVFIGLGFAVAVNYSMFFHGVARLGVGVSIALFYLYPVFVTVAARFVLGEPFSLTKGLALAIAVVGCSLVSGVWENAVVLSSVGIVFILSSAVGCAAYTLLVKVAIRDHPPSRVLAYSLAFALPFLLPATLLSSETLIASFPITVWGIVLLIVVFPTLLGYYLFALALKRIESGRASIVGTLEPVLASLLAFAVLGERLTALQITGMLLILTGSILAQYEVRTG